jgi:hypothetical protein
VTLTAIQQSNARLLFDLTTVRHGLPTRVALAVICCALTESSLINTPLGDISPVTGQQSTSCGFFQQTAGYGPRADRMDPAKALDMFLAGGPQGQPAFVATDWNVGDLNHLADCIQAVQRSEYDGLPHRGITRPYAANYRANMPLAQQITTALEATSMGRMLVDLADVLRAAGVTVIEMPGWKDNADYSDGATAFDPRGIILHHDAEGLGFDNDPSNDMNVPNYMQGSGHGGSQLWVRKDGAFCVLAAGRKWHAGSGDGWGAIRAGNVNADALGIETDHTTGDPWPAVMVDAINRGSRALVRHYGWNPSDCCGHREYAPGRKPDPENFDLNAWRAYLASAVTDPPDPHPGDDDVTLDELMNAQIKYEKTDNATGEKAIVSRRFGDLLGDIGTLLERMEYRIQEQDHRAAETQQPAKR